MGIDQINESIILQINTGDEKAFSKLYQTYYVYLNAVVFYYINDESLSREIVNDVFLQIWEKQGTLRFPIHSYLIRATQNKCIDYLRSLRSYSRVLEEHKDSTTTSYQENYIRSTPQPLQYVELRQAEEEIEKAIRLLPTRCQEVFTVYYYENKPVEEIADELGIKISTVRVHLKNAFDRLRKLLEHLLLFSF